MKKRSMILVLTFVLVAFMTGGVMAEPFVKFSTTKGDFIAEMNSVKAPDTVNNFVKYVKDGFFDGLIFHRVIGHFMVQGGGFTPDMKQKSPTYPAIKNEAYNGLKNDRGTLAMARTGDPHSATSQFFVNVVDNDFLNFKSKDMRGWGYAVFAKVVVGMDVVDKIKAVKTAHKGGHGDVPLEAVIINKAELLDKLPGTDKKTEVKKEVPTEDEIKTHADEKGK